MQKVGAPELVQKHRGEPGHTAFSAPVLRFTSTPRITALWITAQTNLTPSHVTARCPQTHPTHQRTRRWQDHATTPEPTEPAAEEEAAWPPAVNPTLFYRPRGRLYVPCPRVQFDCTRMHKICIFAPCGQIFCTRSIRGPMSSRTTFDIPAFDLDGKKHNARLAYTIAKHGVVRWAHTHGNAQRQ